MGFRHVLWDSPCKSLKAASQAGLDKQSYSWTSRPVTWYRHKCAWFYFLWRTITSTADLWLLYTQFVLDFLREEPANRKTNKTWTEFKREQRKITLLQEWWSQYEPWEGVVEDKSIFSRVPDLQLTLNCFFMRVTSCQRDQNLNENKSGLRIHSLLH